MFTLEEVRTMAGMLGNVFALFLFLSPTPTFIRIWRKKSVEQFSPIPYLVTFANCMAWALYGLPIVRPNNILGVTINGTGIFIEIIYISLFILYSTGKTRQRVILIAIGELFLFATMTVLVLTLAHTHEKRTMVVGLVCVVLSSGTYASPLSVMRMVINTKSVEYMPFALSLACCANGASWVVYALCDFDLFILVPNGLGTLLSVAQLILYGTYHKSTQRMMEERKGRVKVPLLI